MFSDSLVVGFSKPRHTWLPLSLIIRKVQNTEYSHVYIVLDSSYLNRKIVFQASGSAVNFMTYDHFIKKNKTLCEYSIGISKDTKKKVLQYAFDKAGTPYGVKQIFGMGWALALERLTGSKRNPFDDDDKTYVCSEIVAEILKDYINLTIDTDTDVITPKDIFAIVSTIGKPM